MLRRMEDKVPHERNHGRITREGFIRRIAVAPFEVAIGLVTVWFGVAGLLDWQLATASFDHVLPPTLLIFVQLLYTLSGVALVMGIIYRIREVEIFGLVALLGSLLIRGAVVMIVVNGNMAAFPSLFRDATVCVAILIRLWVMLGARAVVLAERARATDGADAVTTVAI